MTDAPKLLDLDVADLPKRLGEREVWRPTYEVGGKLAVKNLHAVSIELRKALRAGFKKRELMVWRGHDSNARLFLVAGFVVKHMTDEPDLCGDLLDRYEWLRANGYDGDMLYVSILDPETRKYEVGFLDQPKRTTHSIPSTRAVKHIGLLHASGINRATRRALGGVMKVRRHAPARER